MMRSPMGAHNRTVPEIADSAFQQKLTNVNECITLMESGVSPTELAALAVGIALLSVLVLLGLVLSLVRTLVIERRHR